MPSTLTKLDQSENWTQIKVEYKMNVKMGSTINDRWMVYGKNATPASSWSLLNHSTTKSDAVSTARDIAKGYKPSILKVEGMDGKVLERTEYE